MKVGVLVPPRQFERVSPNLVRTVNVAKFRAGVDWATREVTPPYEAAVLATYVKSLGHEVCFLDANGLDLLPADATEWIRREKPDLLIVHCGDNTFAQDVVFVAYAEATGVKAILWDEILAPYYADRVFTDFPFVKRILGEEPEANMSYFLANPDATGAVKSGGPGVPLDALPTIDFSLLPMKQYQREGRGYWLTILMRGCAHGKCSFCIQSRSSIRGNFRLRSIENIQAELDAVIPRHRIQRLFFFTYELNVNKERVHAVSELMKRYPGCEWECFMRADHFDEAMLAAMRDSGCLRIHVGVENVDPRVVKFNEKGVSAENVADLTRLAKKRGIEVYAYVVLGTPHEDLASIEFTMAFLKKIGPTNVAPALLRPFPAIAATQTLISNQLVERDYYEASISGETRGRLPLCRTLHMSSRDLAAKLDAVEQWKKGPKWWWDKLVQVRRRGEFAEGLCEMILRRSYRNG